MHTLEVVTFRTKIDPVEFVDANDEVTSWLKRQPGFVSRHLALRDDAHWVDMVIWTDREQAERAASRLLEEIGHCKAMAAIEPDSIVMSHGEIRASTH